MARPPKSGISYFPLDVVMDDSIKLIEAEFGLIGFAVVVKLWQKIYGGDGYYCEWTNEVALLFSRELGLGGNVVSEIINATIRRGIFDKDLFDKYGILTSKGVQSRYFEAAARRKDIEVKKQYLLVNVAKKAVIVDINPINVSNNEENVSNNPQSKSNKSKSNKSKTNNILPEIPAELSNEWNAFVDMRKKINHPMIDHAKSLNYSKLMKLSDGNIETAKAILQQSVMNSWRGLYPLKEVDGYGASGKSQRHSEPETFEYGETLG